MGEIYQYNDPMDYKNIRLGVPKPVQNYGYYSNLKFKMIQFISKHLKFYNYFYNW